MYEQNLYCVLKLFYPAHNMHLLKSYEGIRIIDIIFFSFLYETLSKSNSVVLRLEL
jgi:hypothetical protein